MAKLMIQTIYEQYKNDVYAYLLGLTHDKPLSEDLTSEVFLGAMKSLPTFKGNSSIKTWLFSIARHQWYRHLRKTRKELNPEELIEVYMSDHLNLESNMITKELVGRIHELLDQESQRNRDVVLMRVNGYSYFEIAKRCQISENSARVLDFRTKGRLRAMLKKEGYTGESNIL